MALISIDQRTATPPVPTTVCVAAVITTPKSIQQHTRKYGYRKCSHSGHTVRYPRCYGHANRVTHAGDRAIYFHTETTLLLLQHGYNCWVYIRYSEYGRCRFSVATTASHALFAVGGFPTARLPPSPLTKNRVLRGFADFILHGRPLDLFAFLGGGHRPLWLPHGHGDRSGDNRDTVDSLRHNDNVRMGLCVQVRHMLLLLQ